MSDPAERLDILEKALLELKAIAASLPDSDQANRVIRTEEKVSRLLAFALIPTLLLVGMMVIMTVTAAQTHHAASANRAGIRCVLAELAEHRNTNHDFNRRIAESLKVAPEGPQTLLPGRPTEEELEEVCAQYWTHQQAGQ